LHAPIAATGNTAIHLDSTKVTFAKMWAAEVIDYMREGPVKPLTDKAPECVVLIGYHPYVAQRLIAGMNGTKSLALCNSRIPGATLSCPDCSLGEFETHLKSLINEISQNGTEGGKR
jgi:CO dehydrogenase/acetyl-CoA synthase epsilon subunit